MALAKGARAAGAQIFEQTRVTGVTTRGTRVTGVTTDAGDIEAEVVVNCTGMWGREFGQDHGVALPLQALAHYYVVTENIPGLGRQPPDHQELGRLRLRQGRGRRPHGRLLRAGQLCLVVPRHPGRGGVRHPAGGLGPPRPVLRADDRTRPRAGRDRHPAVLQRTGELHAGRLLPPRRGPRPRELLRRLRIQLDRVPHRPGRRRGARPSGSSTATRPSTSRRPTLDGSSRSRPTVAISSSASWRPSTRPTRSTGRSSSATARAASADPRSTTGSRAAGAVFGELAGWERANWYAVDGVAAEGEPAYGRPHFFDAWAEEHRAVREGVGLFDISSFGKLLVQGRDALALLQKLSSGDVDVEPGQVVYTQWLNERGGIEADVTVTRVARDRVPRPHGSRHGRPRREQAAPAHRRQLRHRHRRERGARDAVGDGSALTGPARAADGRGPLRRGVPVPFVATHRPRADVRPGHAHHLRRRARLGAARPRRTQQCTSTRR